MLSDMKYLANYIVKKAKERGCDVEDRSEANVRDIFRKVTVDMKVLNPNFRGREQEKWTTTVKKLRLRKRADLDAA